MKTSVERAVDLLVMVRYSVSRQAADIIDNAVYHLLTPDQPRDKESSIPEEPVVFDELAALKASVELLKAGTEGLFQSVLSRLGPGDKYVNQLRGVKTAYEDILKMIGAMMRSRRL